MSGGGGDLEARLANLEAQLHGARMELKQIKEEIAKNSCKICDKGPAQVCQGCFEAFLQQMQMNRTCIVAMDEIK